MKITYKNVKEAVEELENENVSPTLVMIYLRVGAKVTRRYLSVDEEYQVRRHIERGIKDNELEEFFCYEDVDKTCYFIKSEE